MTDKDNKSKINIERRRAKRIAVEDSFAFFIVIPNHLGMSRVYIRDISTSGLSFTLDTDHDFSKGQEFQARLYTSPAVYLPIEMHVVRVADEEVAVSFMQTTSKPVQALSKFLEFMDLASEAVVMEEVLGT